MADGLKRNFAANFAGMAWAALMQLAFTPLYLRVLGAEAYGLIGFFLVLQATLQILDFGITPTISREVARYTVMSDRADEARDFVRTFELVYWLIGIAIGAVLFGGAGVIARQWLHGGTLPRAVLTGAIARMGIVCAFQWPVTFYQAALRGLERQVPLNALKIAAATAASGGAAIALFTISPDIETFFDVQVTVYAIHAAVLAVIFWRAMLPSARAARFVPMLIRNVWRFTAGMAGITIAAVILTQIDKVTVSRLLPLSAFGYYTLGSVVASGLLVIVTPMFNTLFPRFAALIASGDDATLRRLYHDSTQAMAVLILPPAALIVFFSREIVQVWTGSADAVRGAAAVASLLVIGTAINGLLNVPYALQLAHGWTNLALSLTILSIVIVAPLVFVLARYGGATGVAAAWPFVKALNLAISVPMTHRRLLHGCMARWFFADVMPPLAMSVAIVAVAHAVVPSSASRLTTLVFLVVVLACATAGAAIVSRSARTFLREMATGAAA